MMLDDNCKHVKVNLKDVVSDILKCCEHKLCKLCISIVLFLIISYILCLTGYFKNENNISFQSNAFVTIFSSLLGFGIAGYAILLSFSKEIICALTFPFKEKEDMNPFKVLSATFSYCCFFLLVTVIIALFYNHSFLYIQFLLFFSTYSTVLTFDLIFNLYSTSTYLLKYKDCCKEKNDDVNDNLSLSD